LCVVDEKPEICGRKGITRQQKEKVWF